ncbi:hypothetical protein TRSC58_07003 [Trypanosoma rangeli SC58]|uniref:Retrotransposon hot spot (RHS) protein n=1 Tax=Trypanosoma rangeli SC58 TaxID=429131 RepID=A0A061IU13_TRYRA|nr:hypothetical protein TRSC58_07003 [Trypanosoma rangeli SC58]
MSKRREKGSHAIEEPPARRRRVEGELQRPRWTLASSVVDVLYVRVGESNTIWLNDFLRRDVGPNRAVAEDQNVMMEVFMQEPAEYVTDQRLIREILNSPGCQLFEDARRLREAARMLTERDVATLRDWKDFADKRIVSDTACVKLNAALQQAEEDAVTRENERTRRLLYACVYSARWSHVVEVAGGEGVGMEVREGQPPTMPWKFQRRMG